MAQTLWKVQESASRWSWGGGGLGIHNLETMGCALHIRWLWAEKTDPARPWAKMKFICG
jgi:hypothetical protein